MMHRAFVVTILATAASAPALAAFVTVNSGPFTFSTDVVNQTITIGQFDPSLGTLTKVDVTLSGNLGSTLTVVPGASPSGGGYKVTWSKDPAPSGFYPPGDPNNTWGFRFQISDSSSLGLTAGNAVVSSGNITPSAIGLTGTNSFTYGINDTQSYSLTSGLNPFIGVGLFNFAANANTFDSFSVSGAGSGASQSLATKLTGTLSATYTYVPTAVPLPAAFPLLAAGLALFGLGGSRRSAAA
jgi:hypothetical protein